MTDTASLPAAADRLDAAAAALLRLAPAVRAGAPWPLAADFGTGPEASWGAPEVLAHVEEMLPFWLGEVERILEGPSDAPVPFGRIADDAVRLGVIGRDRTVPVRELLSRIQADAVRVSGRIREFAPTDGERVGLHPRLGEMTVAEILERFLVTHVEDHVEQLTAILGADREA